MEPNIKNLEKVLRERGLETTVTAINGPSLGWYMMQVTVSIAPHQIMVATTKWSATVSDRDFAFGVEQSLKAQGYDLKRPE